MTGGLLRQRRNLFITSVVIIFLRFGGVQVKKITLLGTELSFDKIEVLYVGIWIAFLYFLVRYYQYFKQEPDLGIMEEFWGKMNALSFRSLREEATKQYPSSENYGGEFQFSQLKKTAPFIRQGSVVVSRNESGEQEMEKYSIDIRKYSSKLLVAGVHVVVHRSMITDYFLPFLVALIALLYGFSGNWEGSFLNVLRALFNNSA